MSRPNIADWQYLGVGKFTLGLEWNCGCKARKGHICEDTFAYGSYSSKDGGRHSHDAKTYYTLQILSQDYCITLYFRGRKISRKVNLKYFREKIFSRIYCSRENIFPRKYLPAKISSRENIFPRKYPPAKIFSRDFFPCRKYVG